jgi:hypothetical protein
MNRLSISGGREPAASIFVSIDFGHPSTDSTVWDRNQYIAIFGSVRYASPSEPGLYVPNPRCDGVAKLNEINDWKKFLEMADAGTLTIGRPKCARVWAPENQPEIAARVRSYLKSTSSN